jgi:hypothetical protein
MEPAQRLPQRAIANSELRPSSAIAVIPARAGMTSFLSSFYDPASAITIVTSTSHVYADLDVKRLCSRHVHGQQHAGHAMDEHMA